MGQQYGSILCFYYGLFLCLNPGHQSLQMLGDYCKGFFPVNLQQRFVY